MIEGGEVFEAGKGFDTWLTALRVPAIRKCRWPVGAEDEL